MRGRVPASVRSMSSLAAITPCSRVRHPSPAEPISWGLGVVLILLAILSAGLGWQLFHLRQLHQQTLEEKAAAWQLSDEVLKEMAHWRDEADSLERDRRVLLRQIQGAATHLAEASVEKKRLQELQAMARADHEAREQQWEQYGSALETTLGATRQTLSSVSRQAAELQATAAGQVQTLQGQLSDLSQNHKLLAGKAAQTEAKARNLAGLNEELSSSRTALQGDVQRLEGCVGSLRAHNQSLASEVSALKSERNCLESKVHTLESKVQCLTAELSSARAK